MRENMTVDWAFGIRGALENMVKENFPSEIRNWPLIQVFDFEAYTINDQFMVIILKDKLAGVPYGPGKPKAFPFSDHPSLPPQEKDVDLWQAYLRNKFSLRNEDAAVLFPIKDSGKSSAVEDYKLFTKEEKLFWDHQIKFILVWQMTHLKLGINTTPIQPTSITVSGDGSRVNIGSQDSSINIISKENTEIFDQLKELLAKIKDENDRNNISKAITEMENSVGTKDFNYKYKDFMATIADHITVFGPLAAALASMIG